MPTPAQSAALTSCERCGTELAATLLCCPQCQRLVHAAKFKALAVLVVTKGKLLLFGLTKIGTLFSMLATLGLYWTRWGFAFALGFVVSIYIHEMGHVDALRRCGIAASPPMFIPGFGAFVRLKQRVLNPIEDARIGLAGPVWVLAAAVVAYVIGMISG